MAIKCVNISDNQKLDSVSPVAAVGILINFTVMTVLMDLGILYLIVVLTTSGLIFLFLQYSPRYVFLLWKYLFKHSYLIASYRDNEYIGDISEIEEVKKVDESTDIYID